MKSANLNKHTDESDSTFDFDSISTEDQTQENRSSTVTINTKKIRNHKTFIMTPRGAHSKIILVG